MSNWYSPEDNASSPVDPDAPEDDDGVVVPTLVNCSLPPPAWAREYDVATATVCGMYLVFGLVCAFFGYR